MKGHVFLSYFRRIRRIISFISFEVCLSEEYFEKVQAGRFPWRYPTSQHSEIILLLFKFFNKFIGV